MNKIDGAISQFQSMDSMAKEERWMNQIHPSIKLFLTVLFIGLTVSFPKYNLTGLFGMILYPFVLFQIGELSFRESLYRLRVVLPIVCIVGIANPFFDRAVVTRIGEIGVTGGVLSMLTLMLKAVLSVLASYLLIVTTSIEKICYALQQAHFPQILVTEVLLIYRYISVLLAETRRVTQAYHLRAPGQKGIAIGAWGPLVGQMLLRSMDRAERLYQSMCLRGFDGTFHLKEKSHVRRTDILYLLIWTALLLILRLFPVLEWVGRWFVR